MLLTDMFDHTPTVERQEIDQAPFDDKRYKVGLRSHTAKTRELPVLKTAVCSASVNLQQIMHNITQCVYRIRIHMHDMSTLYIYVTT